MTCRKAAAATTVLLFAAMSAHAREFQFLNFFMQWPDDFSVMNDTNSPAALFGSEGEIVFVSAFSTEKDMTEAKVLESLAERAKSGLSVGKIIGPPQITKLPNGTLAVSQGAETRSRATKNTPEAYPGYSMFIACVAPERKQMLYITLHGNGDAIYKYKQFSDLVKTCRWDKDLTSHTENRRYFGYVK